MISAGPGRVVLVIEDEEAMRSAISKSLTEGGFTVLEASDGPAGLETANSLHPDLILLDNRMPSMSGYQMLTRLREGSRWGEQVPVIFLSNIEPGSKEERRDIAAVGPAHYLLKVDTSLDEIVAKVREALHIQN